ncbi:Crp/Fnr family transcriptional regulator [Maribacter polysaccharolyticus]|uniref:Crp/Fnr family transcriptional regulator n=1 Tax=Maribacter polysaccharolyticus TaxID=3020831 RepID=UPI00237F212B|nr:Crp/Fnr family transcriptional regulator [Maribacter polysaccharolyticus]MDE3743400.1 Crp/Fnr family transcriptional regulator [Maribacter polysaccharolyticus]
MNIGLEKYRYYIEVLNGNALFKDLPYSSLTALLKIATGKTWAKKSCILDTQETCYKFYIIISGRIKVYNFDMEKDRNLTLFMLKTNDVFDIFSLIDCARHEVYYETLDKTELLCIPLADMKQWIADHPEFNQNFLVYVIDKMCHLQKYVSDMVFKDAPTRLAHLIYNYLNLNSHELEVINDLTHEELAAMIGTTRAVLNRHLQNFKEEGIICLGRKEIIVTDLPALLSKFGNNN